MANDDPLSFFRRRVEQGHEQVRNRLETFFELALCASPDDVHGAYRDLAGAVKVLVDLLPPDGRPGWLLALSSQMDKYAQHNRTREASSGMMRCLASSYSKLCSEKWERLADANAGIDFDGIFASHFDGSRAGELFQKLVSALEQLAASELIDSRQVIRELERVVATIKRSLKGSHFAKWWTWQYVRKFFKHFAWEMAETVPGLSQAVRAARATVDEINGEMEKIESLVVKDLNSRVDSSVKALDNLEGSFSIEADSTAKPIDRIEGPPGPA